MEPEPFGIKMFSMSTMSGPDASSASSDSAAPRTGENSAFSCCAAVEASSKVLHKFKKRVLPVGRAHLLSSPCRETLTCGRFSNSCIQNCDPVRR